MVALKPAYTGHKLNEGNLGCNRISSKYLKLNEPQILIGLSKRLVLV